MPTPLSQPKPPPLAASSPSKQPHFARRWHRVVGLVSAVSLAYLLATGLPLQFSAPLALGQTFVQQPWVLQRYGVRAPEVGVVSGPVQSIGGLLWYLGQPLAGAQLNPLGEQLLGAVQVGAFVALLTERGLMLLEPESGELEQLPTPSTPSAIALWQPQEQADGVSPGLIIRTASGLFVTEDFDRWAPRPKREVTAEAGAAWAPVTPLAGPALQRLQQQYQGQVITLERWLQDLHSGRFFGAVGVWLVTAASLLLMVLAATGLMLWWRARR